MIKPNDVSGSFSSSSTSDTFPENNESLSTLFSSLFANTETSSRDSKGGNNLRALTDPAIANISGTSWKINSSNYETVNEGNTKNKSRDIQRICSIVAENSAVIINDTSLPLSTADTIVSSDRNKTPTTSSCSSKVPVLTILTTLRTDDDVNAAEEETPGNAGSRNKKLVDNCTLRRVFSSSTSRIPVSTKRMNTSESEKRNLFFPSTRRCVQRLPINDKEPSSSSHQKRPGSMITSNKKYDHIQSKVAAYIRRPTKYESAVNKSSTTRSISPNDSRIGNDFYASAGDGIKRPGSRTSLETYTCENKMPASADVSIDLDKFEYSGDPHHRRVRKYIELALEHSRRKLEKERIIAGHRRDIAKQHQFVLEHSERAHDCWQKAMVLLLDKK